MRTTAAPEEAAPEPIELDEAAVAPQPYQYPPEVVQVMISNFLAPAANIRAGFKGLLERNPESLVAKRGLESIKNVQNALLAAYVEVGNE